MNVLELVLKYENVFEDYIKYSQNKDNKNRKSAFFVKKCNEVQALLDLLLGLLAVLPDVHPGLFPAPSQSASPGLAVCRYPGLAERTGVMTSILRAALLGLTVIATSCQSAPVSAPAPDWTNRQTPPAAPGGAATVDLFSGTYRDGWAGQEYTLTRRPGLLPAHGAGRRHAGVHGQERGHPDLEEDRPPHPRNTALAKSEPFGPARGTRQEATLVDQAAVGRARLAPRR